MFLQAPARGKPLLRDQKDDGARKISFFWKASRNFNDYVKAVIQLSFAITNFEEVIVNKKPRVRGTLSISFSGYLEKDYEETWYRSSLTKFMREVYDKFALGSEFQVMEKDLKKDVAGIVHEIKVYLNLVRPRN